MKKTVLLAALAAMFLSTNADAQILYKVEKQGSDKVSYILGTHHFAPLKVVDEIKALPSIMQGVDKLYGEIEMAQMADPSKLMAMQQSFIAPADSTLDKLFTAEQLDSISKVWEDYTGGQAPLQMLYGMKPSVLSTQLAALRVQRILPELNPMEGIDMTMQNRAAELGKPVAGLETMEFQIDMLYNQPIAEQAESLIKSIREEGTEAEKTKKISDAYLAHDIQAIYDEMLEADSDEPGMLERMIYSRNDNWVKILSEEMPSEALMVVVGAGHLPGERGVLEGLRKAGFTITPVE